MNDLPPNRPNILLITCHDLGRHLGCYGVRSVVSPNLDALAGEGVRFTRAFTISPSCSPSRAAMATGRYPHCNGVMGLAHPPYGWDLNVEERHLASILREAGYQTHLFGFQHVTSHILRLGFDHLHGFDRLTGCHEPAWGRRVAEHVTVFLENGVTDRPLYLEINLEEPHRPYDQGGATPDTSRGVTVPPYLPPGSASREEMAALQGAIRQADDAVGRILRALQNANLVEDTLILFVADHGLAMPRAKCTLYDPGLEISMIVHWSGGGLMGGRTVDGMVSNIDILPTVLDLVDVPVPDAVQGRSHMSLLRGLPCEARREIYAEKTYHSYYDPMRAVRTERFKYIRNFDTAFAVEVPADVEQGAIFRSHIDRYHGTEHDEVELYDLRDDPLENHNLAGSEPHAETERLLAAQLLAWMTQTDDPLLQGPIPSPAYRRSQLRIRHIDDGR